MSELPYYCFAKDTWKPTGRFHVFHGLLVLVLQGTASLLPCESPPTSWLTCAATAHAVLKKPVRDREGEPENDLLFRDSPLLGKRTKITLSGIIHFGKIEVALNIAPKLSKTRPLFFWAKGKETWDPGCVLVTREPPLTTGSSTIWQEGLAGWWVTSALSTRWCSCSSASGESKEELGPFDDLFKREQAV